MRHSPKVPPPRLLGLRPLPNHFPPLHGLRVLAILAVLAVHVTWGLRYHGLLEPGPLYAFGESLWFGMDLFFVLSGFLIGMLLLHGDSAGRAGRMGRFYARRSFRIFPLYYVALALLCLIEPATPAQLRALGWELAYLSNYHRFEVFPVMPWAWSLCVEEHFYLLVPALIGMLRWIPGHGGRLAILGVLWLVAPVFRALALSAAPEPDGLLYMEMFATVYQRTHMRFDTLIAGVTLAYLHHHFGPTLALHLRRPPLAWSLAVLALGCFGFLLAPPADLWVRYGPWQVAAWGSVTSVMYLSALALILHRPGMGARILGARPFLWLATLGYGIYVVHIPAFHRIVVPLLHAVEAASPAAAAVRWPLALALLVLVAAALSWVLHLLVERPSLWLRDRLAP